MSSEIPGREDFTNFSFNEPDKKTSSFAVKSLPEAVNEESQGNLESGEKVFVENERGQKLAAMIHRPREKGKFPAVILLEGLTENKDEEHITSLAVELSQGGIAAVRFDYAGIGESEGIAEVDYNFSNFLSDTAKILEFLENQDYVDVNRIGVWGHSMGAMLSILFVSEHPEIRSLCSVAPAEMENSLRQMPDLLEKLKEQGYIELNDSGGKSLRLPYSAMEDAQKYNIGSSAEKIKQPVLVIVGEQDNIVPLEQIRSVYKKIGSEEKALKEIPGMKHHYKHNPGDLAVVNRKVVNFFQDHL